MRPRLKNQRSLLGAPRSTRHIWYGACHSKTSYPFKTVCPSTVVTIAVAWPTITGRLRLEGGVVRLVRGGIGVRRGLATVDCWIVGVNTVIGGPQLMDMRRRAAFQVDGGVWAARTLGVDAGLGRRRFDPRGQSAIGTRAVGRVPGGANATGGLAG
jgi:hypothetical protein